MEMTPWPIHLSCFGNHCPSKQHWRHFILTLMWKQWTKKAVIVWKIKNKNSGNWHSWIKLWFWLLFPTCAYVELHGLLLLPPFNPCILLLQGVDVGAHSLHHHAVDGSLMLRPGTSCSSTSCPSSSHRSWAQLGDVSLLCSLVWR